MPQGVPQKPRERERNTGEWDSDEPILMRFNFTSRNESCQQRKLSIFSDAFQILKIISKGLKVKKNSSVSLSYEILGNKHSAEGGGEHLRKTDKKN